MAAARKRIVELLVETGLPYGEKQTRALSELRTRRGNLGAVIDAPGMAIERPDRCPGGFEVARPAGIHDARGVRGIGGQMGMSDTDSRRPEALIRRPQGILLVTGPTGSGKRSPSAGAPQDPVRGAEYYDDRRPREREIPGVNRVARYRRGSA